MDQFLKIVNIVSPVFLVVGLGYVLARVRLLGEKINAHLSRLVFWVAAPALLFRSAARTDLAVSLDWGLLAGIYAVTLAAAFGTYFLAFRAAPARRGVIAQSAFRSNLVFIGLPVVMNAFPGSDAALGVTAVIVGFVSPLYNFLAVMVLSLPHAGQNGKAAWGPPVRDMLLNPLVLGCALGLLFSAAGLKLPTAADTTLKLIGDIAMPLALLGVGAGINLRALQAEFRLTLLMSAIKLGLVPLGAYLLLPGFGVSGLHLQIAVLLLATSNAVVSHIMAREMKGDERLAASLVIGTTLYSILSLSCWVWLLL